MCRFLNQINEFESLILENKLEFEKEIKNKNEIFSIEHEKLKSIILNSEKSDQSFLCEKNILEIKIKELESLVIEGVYLYIMCLCI
jgi:hypothetical protein